MRPTVRRQTRRATKRSRLASIIGDIHEARVYADRADTYRKVVRDNLQRITLTPIQDKKIRRWLVKAEKSLDDSASFLANVETMLRQI